MEPDEVRESPPAPGTGPAVIVIGALDPACGDGIALDVAWLTRLGVRAGVVATAIGETALEPGRFEAQLECAQGALGGALRAIRTGRLVNPEQSRAIVRIARERRVPLVVDPLVDGDGAAAIVLPLLRHATLLTPNVREAVLLGGETWNGTRDGLLALARTLAGAERTAAVTGGVLAGGQVTVAIAGPAGERLVDAARADRGPLVGAGAAFASAASGYIALGLPAFEAAAAAHRLVARAVAASAGVAGAALTPEPWSV